jgi:hypothetical protein
MVGETKELVELQGVSLGEQLGDAGGLSRLALRHRVTDGARLGTRESGMGPGAHILVTELAAEPEILRVLEVVELHRLGHRGTAAGDHWDRHRHDQHQRDTHYSGAAKAASAALPIPTSIWGISRCGASGHGSIRRNDLR